MKNVFFITALLFTGMVNSFAQDVDFGVKAGLNFASLSGDSDGLDGNTGFYIGGFAEVDLSDKFQIQPELLFSIEGADAEDGDGEAGLAYIRLPIMAKYAVAPSLDVVAGPQIGFIVDEADFDGDAINSFDFGLGAGLEYELENGLGFGARYNFGIANLSDVDGFDLRQNNLQLGLSYEF